MSNNPTVIIRKNLLILVIFLCVICPVYVYAYDYAQVVKKDKPLAYWRLNGSSLNKVKDSIGTTHGKRKEGVTLNVRGPCPRNGWGGFSGENRAADFPGKETGINLGDNLTKLLAEENKPTYASTVELFLKTDNVSSGVQALFWIGLYRKGAVIGLSRKGNDFLVYGRSCKKDRYDKLDVEYGHSAGYWHHIVGIADYKHKEYRIYVDGHLISRKTTKTMNRDVYTGSMAKPRVSAIGNRGGTWDQGFQGKIDEVAVYGYALDDPDGNGGFSDSRVSAHYKTARGGKKAEFDKNKDSIKKPWMPGEAVSVTDTPQPQLVAEPYQVVTKSENDWRSLPWCGSPSIIALDNDELLVSYTEYGSNNSNYYLARSENGGKTWNDDLTNRPAVVGASLFQCKSGIYMIGPGGSWRKGFTGGNDPDLVISRSTDGGCTWSEPVQITSGLACHVGNTGVLVSNGRVTYSFEVAGALNEKPGQTVLKDSINVNNEDLDQREFWVKVDDASVAPRWALMSLSQYEDVLHCRIMKRNIEENKMLLKPERWGGHPNWNVAENSDGPWQFTNGAELKVASSQLGNHRDFWSMAVDAPDNSDTNLCDPNVWRVSNPVANPFYAYSKALYDVFGLKVVYRNKNGQMKFPESRRAGWLEGVCVRLSHPEGDGKILNLLRTAQNKSDSLSGRILIDDSGKELKAEFERIGFDEGLGVTHCYAEYDEQSELYWMTSNVNRDSTRDLTGIDLRGPSINERSNLGLFYSRNAVDWFLVGMVAYSRDWAHSYHYPHFDISGEDMFVIARSHVESPITDKTMNKLGGADNHDANAVTFHRIRNFRKLANRDFIDYIQVK